MTPVDKQVLEKKQTQPIGPEEVFISWSAPARLYKKRSREFYSTIGVIVLLLSVILIFAKEFLLVGAIISLAFFSYVLASAKPPKIENKITSRGVRVYGKLYKYEVLGRFWFESKWNQHLVKVEYLGGFPGELVMILSSAEQEKEVKKILEEYLVEEMPPESAIDKAATWLQEKVPLETE